MGKPSQTPLLSLPSAQLCPNWVIFPHKGQALSDQCYQQPKQVCSTLRWKRQKAQPRSESSLCRHLLNLAVPAPSTRALLSAFPFPSLLAQLEPGVQALPSSSSSTTMAQDLFSKPCHPGHPVFPSSTSISSAALKAAPQVGGSPAASCPSKTWWCWEKSIAIPELCRAWQAVYRTKNFFKFSSKRSVHEQA